MFGPIVVVYYRIWRLESDHWFHHSTIRFFSVLRYEIANNRIWIQQFHHNYYIFDFQPWTTLKCPYNLHNVFNQLPLKCTILLEKIPPKNWINLLKSCWFLFLEKIIIQYQSHINQNLEKLFWMNMTESYTVITF